MKVRKDELSDAIVSLVINTRFFADQPKVPQRTLLRSATHYAPYLLVLIHRRRLSAKAQLCVQPCVRSNE